MRSVPMRCSAITASAAAKIASAPIASRRAIRAPGREASLAPPASAGSSVGSRCARTRSPSAGASPSRAGTLWRRGRVQRDRILVGAQHLGGDARPGVARGRLGRRGGERGAACGVQREVAQRLGERGRVAARHEQAVDAVGHDVAVARDVRRDDRRAGRERLGQHHAEALAAERRRAQHVRLGEHRRLRSSLHLPCATTSRVSSMSGTSSSALDADDVQRRRDVLAQRLEGAQQHRQPLALDRLADEGDPQRAVLVHGLGRTRRRRRPGRRRRWGSRGTSRRRSAAPSRRRPARPRSARAGGSAAATRRRSSRGGWRRRSPSSSGTSRRAERRRSSASPSRGSAPPARADARRRSRARARAAARRASPRS